MMVATYRAPPFSGALRDRPRSLHQDVMPGGFELNLSHVLSLG